MEIKKIQTVAELAAVQKTNIANQTENTKTSAKSTLVLNETDADSEIIGKEAVKTLTSNNSKELIRDSKGTTFVVIGNTGCGRCRSFENKALGSIVSNLGDKANFVEMNYSNDTKLYNELKKEAGKTGSVGLPAIVKIVDGKAVEFMDYNDYSKIYTDADKMTEYLNKKITTEASDKKNTKDTKEATTTNPNAGKITATTTQNVQENLYNQKGTTFVEITGQRCSICKEMEPYLKAAAQELGDSANFISVTHEEDKQLCWELLHEAGYNKESASIPMMIKYVDGKPVELMKRGDLTGHKKNFTEYLTKKVENAEARMTAVAADDEDYPECNISADDDTAKNEGNVQEDSAQKVLKQKLETLKESLNVTKSLVQTITTDSLENAIESANSIDELKTAVNTYSSGLDFSVQINLTSVVNDLSYDTDLDLAKEKLLEIL